ncbi:rhodanese [Shewanella algae]|uniref:rhodanese-like domain-containing protein n=1 Tax=Shewanella algae TaxID=38313 RepID=UPI001184547E|nr:rhodanese-like domain-containing protein [Shewanella algae]TVK94408.1 rhodanese [Shewanella algae]
MNEQIKHYEDKLQYEIDSWDLYEPINEGINVIVIDARSAEAFEIQHIPGSINIPHRTMDVSTTSHLDKSALYVSYCDGIGCNASTKGALNMARLGFNVKELLGGLDWWLRDGYATEGTSASSGKEVVCGC